MLFNIINVLIFIFGAILLYYGAELLIKGSRLFAEKFKISPIIVGITLVAFGTSLPELIVSIIASLKGEPGLIIGNVVGSNIANIALVLAVTAIITPIKFSFNNISFDLYFLVLITTLIFYFIFLDQLNYLQGILLIILLLLYCLRLYNQESSFDDESSTIAKQSNFIIFIKTAFGIVGLGLGSNFFVLGAQNIADVLNVSRTVIGMSIVALGTSLPELAASLAAARQNQPDFVIGNIIGSNIMNIVAVLGITSLIHPISIEFLQTILPSIFMLALTILLFILLKINKGISKINGVVLLIIYFLFLYLNFNSDLVFTI